MNTHPILLVLPHHTCDLHTGDFFRNKTVMMLFSEGLKFRKWSQRFVAEFALQNDAGQCNKNRIQRNVTSWKMFSYSVTFYMGVSKSQKEAVQKEI